MAKDVSNPLLVEEVDELSISNDTTQVVNPLIDDVSVNGDDIISNMPKGGADPNIIEEKKDKTPVSYQELKKIEKKKKEEEDRKRYASVEFKTDKKEFVSYLMDNYLLKEEDGTRPALFKGLGMDNLNSIFQEFRYDDYAKLVKDELSPSETHPRNKFLNLSDSDIDEVIKHTFDEIRIKEQKEEYLPYQRQAYLSITEGKDYEALPNWLISSENADINSLPLWEREAATNKKKLTNYIAENYKDLDVNQDGTIDETEQTDEYKDLLLKYDNSVLELNKTNPAGNIS